MVTGSPSPPYLHSADTRAALMRLDTGAILKRFFFCEDALIRGQAGWLAAIASHEIKMLLPRFVWEDSLVADALRRRVLELRYPSRLIEIGDDEPVVSVFEEARHAPSALTFLAGIARTLIPALRDAYHTYLKVADDLSDGPSKRFLDLACREKDRQIAELWPLVAGLLRDAPELREQADTWAAALSTRLEAMGGLGLQAPLVTHAEAGPLPGRTTFALAQVAARDPRFHLGRFYWPDNVDPSYPYGEGIELQLRSALSHLNEVWAVENAGAILEAFAPILGWEFVVDAARWLYDESRHALMGWTRLRDWGFAPELLAVGSFLYDSAADQDPIYRLAMLHFFETKNIGKKPRRAAAFGTYGDAVSRHDMEFDWADEGIHAAYGKRWLAKLVAARGWQPESLNQVQQQCSVLVERAVASASAEEIADVRAATKRLVTEAYAIAAHS